MFYFFLALTLAASIIHIAVDKKARSAGPIVEIFLLYFLVIGVGLNGIMCFIMHAFFADYTAHYIGWAAGSPFQFEVAASNLALGILGLLCLFIRGNFWLATIISCSVFLLGCTVGHIREIIVARNFSPGNAGPALYYDIAFPVVLFVLYIVMKVKTKQ